MLSPLDFMISSPVALQAAEELRSKFPSSTQRSWFTPVRGCRFWLIAFIAIASGGSGCSQFIDPNVPEPIRPYVEPDLGGDYLLYRPSNYNRLQSWPLIVVCHGSFPDDAGKRIRAWTQLAESRGFLVVAPTLTGSAKRWSNDVDQQVRRQRQDEARILSTVRHITAGHSISTDRVFIHGWGTGARAALFTGLKHPELFRAIALSHPQFDEAFLLEVADRVDPHQAVFVDYTLVDTITGKHARHCIDWLRPRCSNLREDPSGSVSSTKSDRPVEFFEEVVRTIPWIRIRAFGENGTDRLAMRFKLHSSFVPKRASWEFGDQDRSTQLEPLHRFQKDGVYRIRVEVEGADGRKFNRVVDLSLPDATISIPRRQID